MSQRAVRVRSVLLCILMLVPLVVFAQSPGVTFAPAMTYGVGGLNLAGMAVADLKGDEKVDVVVVSECTIEPGICGSGLLSVLLGKGDGTFQPAINYDSGGSNAVSVTVADVNGDGKPDLVVVNECPGLTISCIGNGAVGVLLGNGDGTFQKVVSYPSGGFHPGGELAVADVNGDGKLDLLVTNSCAIGCTQAPTEGTVGVLLGNGDGTFQPVVSYLSGGYSLRSIAVVDVNEDGKPDLVVDNLCAAYDCNTHGAVGVLLGNGDGTFQPVVSYSSGGGAMFSLAVADVNEDGKPDLVAVNFCATGECTTDSTAGVVGVLLGNGDGTFQPAVSYRSGGFKSAYIAVADVNRDGKPDLLVTNICAASGDCNGAVGVLLGNGNGTFQPPVSYGSGGYDATFSVKVADVNGDGKPDLIVANSCTTSSNCNGVVGVLLGNGNGTFQPAVSFGSGGEYPQSLAIVDVNGDGRPDLLVANDCTVGSNCNVVNGGVGVLINTPVVTISGSPQQPLTKNAAGDYIARVTVTNTGNVTVSSLQVTIAGTTLGSGSLLSAPAPVTNLAPGAAAVVTLKFPSDSVPPGTTIAPLKISGTYSATSASLSGHWGLSFRSVTL